MSTEQNQIETTSVTKDPFPAWSDLFKNNEEAPPPKKSRKARRKDRRQADIAQVEREQAPEDQTPMEIPAHVQRAKRREERKEMRVGTPFPIYPNTPVNWKPLDPPAITGKRGFQYWESPNHPSFDSKKRRMLKEQLRRLSICKASGPPVGDDDERFAPPPAGGTNQVIRIQHDIRYDENGKEISRKTTRNIEIYGAGGRLLNPPVEGVAQSNEKGVGPDSADYVPRMVTPAMGQYIAGLRTDAGISQRELNTRIGAPNNTIRSIEIGNKYPYRPDDKVLVEIAKYFKVGTIGFF